MAVRWQGQRAVKFDMVLDWHHPIRVLGELTAAGHPCKRTVC